MQQGGGLLHPGAQGLGMAWQRYPMLLGAILNCCRACLRHTGLCLPVAIQCATGGSSRVLPSI